MRILVCALTLLLPPALAAGQSSALDRGSILVDGDATFVSTGADGVDDRTTNLVVRPGVKYFVARRLAVGGEFVLGYSAQGEFEGTSLGIGPSVDYYFGALDAALHPFLSGTVFFGRDRHDPPAGDETVVRRLRLYGAAGLLYLITDQVGVNGALFYQKTDSEVTDVITLSRDAYGLAVGISAFVF